MLTTHRPSEARSRAFCVPSPRDDVESSVDPECVHGHEMRPTVRTRRRQPALGFSGFASRCRAIAQASHSTSSSAGRSTHCGRPEGSRPCAPAPCGGQPQHLRHRRRPGARVALRGNRRGSREADEVIDRDRDRLTFQLGKAQLVCPRRFANELERWLADDDPSRRREGLEARGHICRVAQR